MHYSFNLTIPPNTTELEPETLTCHLTYGTISKVSVAFPPGPKALAHLVILHQEHQVWPTNPDESYAWDNHVIEFESEYDLNTAPYDIKLVGWNNDDTYEHTVTVGINVLRGRYALADLLMMRAPVSLSEGEV